MMNIGILINSFNLGGAEKLMYDVAEVLAIKDENVFVISMKSVETELEKNIKFKLEHMGIVTDTIEKPMKKGRIKAVFKIAAALKKHKIDILHTNGQSPDFYGRIANMMCRKTKNIVTIHNTKGYSKKVEMILQSSTNKYTAVSDDAKKYAENELGIKEIVTIENGIKFNRYENEEKDESKRGINILSVGRVVPQKGYHKIVESMCEYLKSQKDAKWIIVGETQQDVRYYSEVVKKIDEKVKDRIIFTGAVSNPEEYYKKADCFILPSENEGFGIAYIEAMAAGLPVIANKVGVIIDIANAGGNFVEILDKSATQCIQEAMKISEHEIYKNKTFCKKRYDIEEITERYRNIYYELKGNIK